MGANLARFGVDGMKCKNGHEDLKMAISDSLLDSTTMFHHFMKGIMNGTVLHIDEGLFCGRCIREILLEPARMTNE